MLRRQVQDVEGKLPEKVTITLKCPMSGYQGAVYDWVKATGLLRADPEGEEAIRRHCSVRSVKNRIMELRKACSPTTFSPTCTRGASAGLPPCTIPCCPDGRRHAQALRQHW